MSKSYSVFVDDKYYYDFVALYNSWKYYENKIPLKVYVHNGMHNTDRLNQIEKVCKVVYVDRGDMDTTNYLEKFLFKYVGLLQHMDDIEIVLDADMLFLSNMDYLFDYIEEGKIIGSVENDWLTPHHVYYNGDTEQWKIANQNTKNELRKLIGDVIDEYTLDLAYDRFYRNENGDFFKMLIDAGAGGHEKIEQYVEEIINRDSLNDALYDVIRTGIIDIKKLKDSIKRATIIDYETIELAVKAGIRDRNFIRNMFDEGAWVSYDNDYYESRKEKLIEEFEQIIDKLEYDRRLAIANEINNRQMISELVNRSQKRSQSKRRSPSKRQSQTKRRSSSKRRSQTKRRSSPKRSRK